MNYRTIYEVEVFKEAEKADDMLAHRSFYRNKRLAEKAQKKLQRKYPEYEVNVRKLNKNEHQWVGEVYDEVK